MAHKTQRSLWIGLALVALVAIPQSEAGKRRKNVLGKPLSADALDGPVTLASVRDRWSEASAQTRINIPIKKGSDGAGWSSSEWLFAEGESVRMRFSVRRRDDLREVLPNKNLLAGVRLVCDGWTVQNPKKGRGIQVDFHFANYPATARAEFDTDLERLADVERYLRFHVMAVERANDRLVAASPVTAAPPSAPVTAETPRVEAAPIRAPKRRHLDLLSAEVSQEVVRAGEEIELTIRYELSTPDGSPVVVQEQRSLLQAGTLVGSFDGALERAPGTYTSAQRIQIPTEAPAGFYSYRASVSFAELSDEFSVIFEVQ